MLILLRILIKLHNMCITVLLLRQSVRAELPHGYVCIWYILF